MELAGRGESQKEMARIMGVSEHTVEEFLDRARQKYGAKNTAHLVSLCTGKAGQTIKPSPSEDGAEEDGEPTRS